MYYLSCLRPSNLGYTGVTDGVTTLMTLMHRYKSLNTSIDTPINPPVGLTTAKVL